MSDYTITVPADLNDEWSTDILRDVADALSDMTRLRAVDWISTPKLLRYLADEIERQAPRAEGWYHITYRAFGEKRERVIYWTGHDWRLANYPSADRVADPESADTITPVTIGRADS